MNYETYFEDMFESIPDYRKTELLKFLIQNDDELLKEVGFSNDDNKRLSLEFKNNSMEENEEYLDYIKNDEESKIEQILKN